jgi:adenylate cyclase
MFTDLVGSALVEAIGDEAWDDLIRWHDETLRSLFGEHGGEEVDHAGEGFFVAFPDESSGVTCALAVQRRLAEHRRTHGFAPQVRIGLHAAAAADGGRGYRGKGVYEAARIASLAEGGEILASRETAAAAPDAPLADARRVTLKGISAPLEVVTLDWR